MFLLLWYQFRREMVILYESYIEQIALHLMQGSETPPVSKVAYCSFKWSAGLILGLHPANGGRRYKVTPSLIGWAQT